MANQIPTVSEVEFVGTRPNQLVSWADKMANDGAWFKESSNYYINSSNFLGTRSEVNRKNTMYQMYEVYNNMIPMEWFEHVTNPLSAKDANHKKWPAKIRPTNILRTNIDQLIAEWWRRPFNYRVENIGEDGYNRFLDQQNKQVNSSLQQMFVAYAQEEMAEAMTQQGVPPDQIKKQLGQMDPSQVPTPMSVRRAFKQTYKDKLAVQGQHRMDRAMIEYQIRRKLKRCFKDLLIAGECATYKAMVQGEFYYSDISPVYLDWDRNPTVGFAEEGEWVTAFWPMTVSAVVDFFWSSLSEDELKRIQSEYSFTTPQHMFDRIREGFSSTDNRDMCMVYHTVWRGKKEVKECTYYGDDGQPRTDFFDEDDPGPSKDMVIDCKTHWMNEAYEVWRIGSGLYPVYGPVQNQRQDMNNISKLKLPYNAMRFSDTHAPNISVMRIGLPYLIMYMIIGRTLEFTIAKSKGKIFLMDRNAISRKDGWTEEKFFYYLEAKGYALLDRNQTGVDKSWNQYAVVDMSLFDQIKQLIELQNHYKEEWDAILGFNRQRKGQTYASDSNSGNERALFQSNLTTDTIYLQFDEFVERELQGLLDLLRFQDTTGTRRLYNSNVVNDEVMEIDPVEFSSAALGLFLTDNADGRKLDEFKALMQEFAQNGTSPEDIFTMMMIESVTEMKSHIALMSDMKAQLQQQEKMSEEDAAAATDERKKEMMNWEKLLEEGLINTEYDRKEDLEYIKGQFNELSFQKGLDLNANQIPDATEILKTDTKREDIQSKERMERAKLFQEAYLEKLRIARDSIQADTEGRRKERIEKYKVDNKPAPKAKA